MQSTMTKIGNSYSGNNTLHNYHHCNDRNQTSSTVATPNLRSTNYSSLNYKSKAAKRRSAVERLEASKANYVKSEKVLDTKQELRRSSHLKISDGTAPPIEILKTTWKLWTQPNNVFQEPELASNNHAFTNGFCTNDSIPARKHPPKSPRPFRSRSRPDCRSRCNDDFQVKLRQLISAKDVTSSDSEYSNESGDYCPVIQARSKQECSYSLHKSMPDLNGVKIPNGDKCCRVDDSWNDDYATQTLNRSYRATSDYVSRSPSSKQERFVYSRDYESEVRHEDGVFDDDELKPAVFTTNMKCRPILRSKSDVSYRHSKESYVESSKRASKCSPELERFFDSMGLDVTELSNLSNKHLSLSPPQFFESVSSIDSDTRIEQTFGDCDADGDDYSDVNTSGLKNSDLMKTGGPTETSIIERNARVIKWLYNCRKINESQ